MEFGKIALQAEMTINTIIQKYIDKFMLERAGGGRIVNNLITSSEIKDLTYEGIKETLNNIYQVMKDIEYDATASAGDMRDWRRAMEQVGSIMHIGMAYPDNAIRRLKDLADIPVKLVRHKASSHG